MTVHEHAGKPVRPQDRINIGRLVSDYFNLQPDVTQATEKVTFGTSGHRGNASKKSFNEVHIVAICQAVAEYRQQQVDYSVTGKQQPCNEEFEVMLE